MEVKVVLKEGKLYVKSPYNEEFVKRSRQIGGKWNGELSRWVFSESNKDLLDELIGDIYGGIDSDSSGKKVTIEYKASDFEDLDSGTIKVGSTVTVRRKRRDAPVDFYYETVVVRGEFQSSGGSAKSPRPDAEEDVVLRSVIPSVAIDKLTDDKKEIITIKTSVNKKLDLQKEKEILLKRIEEIDRELNLYK